MSKRGNWGDKTIIVLMSDQIRRHKNWCKYYDQETGICEKRTEKCFGSAHCEHYIKGFGLGPLPHEEIPDDVPFIAPYDTKEKWLTAHKRKATRDLLPILLPGRHPYRDEKLFEKQLLYLTENRLKAEFGTVVNETHDRIYIENDGGDIKSFDRRSSYDKKSLWVIED